MILPLHRPCRFSARRLLAAGIFLTAPVLLAGGATQTGDSRSADVNLSGYPPAFKEGYSDGCATARGSYARNDKRFGIDPQYRQGWRDGRDICEWQSKPRR